jgi:quercetin dioxygenase-like cupin family protein
MPYEGQTIANARTGQEMTFVELGERLRIRSVHPPGDAREPEHVHPRQESGAEVTAGSLVFVVAGETRRVGPGERITIPAGTPHRFYNDSGETAHSLQWFFPALDIAAFFETYAALAAQGGLDAKGIPRPMQLAVMIPVFGDEIRVTTPPWPVQRAFAAVLGPVARRRGHRARLTLP